MDNRSVYVRSTGQMLPRLVDLRKDGVLILVNDRSSAVILLHYHYQRVILNVSHSRTVRDVVDGQRRVKFEKEKSIFL